MYDWKTCLPSRTKFHSSEYGPTTTAQEVIAGCGLSGKVAVVTGGYSGLGLETVRILSKAGTFVVVPSRNPAKAKRALSNIPQVEQAAMDLLDPAPIHAFADSFLESHRRLHLLINNAGIMAPPLMRDSRGYESQLATNHLGHFQRAVALWPALQRAQGACIISMSSRAHRRALFDFEDPNFERRPRCLVPFFDGAFLSQAWTDALWDKFSTAAPRRQRRCVERYKIVKRA